MAVTHGHRVKSPSQHEGEAPSDGAHNLRAKAAQAQASGLHARCALERASAGARHDEAMEDGLERACAQPVHERRTRATCSRHDSTNFRLLFDGWSSLTRSLENAARIPDLGLGHLTENYKSGPCGGRVVLGM